jgi:hypothetical protein
MRAAGTPFFYIIDVVTGDPFQAPKTTELGITVAPYRHGVNLEITILTGRRRLTVGDRVGH